MKTIIKYFGALIILLFFYSEAISQPITWKKVYGTAAEENSRVVQQTFDGGYIVGYYNYFTRRSSLLKLNPYGQKEWEKEINDTNGTIGSIVLSSDSGFVFHTTKTRIIKTDPLGNIEWTKIYRYENYETTAIKFKQLNNENYILAGNLLGFNPPFSGIFIAYFDNELNLLWERNFRDSAANTLQDGDINFYNYHIYLTAWTHNGGPRFGNFLIYDLIGNLIYSKTYDTPNQSIKSFINYNDLFYCIGDSGDSGPSNNKLIFQVMDTTGTVLLKKRYSFSPSYSIIKTHDNKFAILSYAAYPISDAVLLKVDSTGNEIYRRFISAGDSTIDALHDIKLTSDNGFVMTGVTSYDILRGDIANIFVVKTDSEGNSPPVRIEQISSAVPEDFTLHQNYPNPFNPSTNIKLDIPQKGHLKIVLYEMLGKEIRTLFNDETEAGSYSLILNFYEYGLNLTSGAYFICATYKDNLQTIRAVFNK